MYQQLNVLHWHSMGKPQKVLSGQHEEAVFPLPLVGSHPPVRVAGALAGKVRGVDLRRMLLLQL